MASPVAAVSADETVGDNIKTRYIKILKLKKFMT
jgi:hypothetical protein